ncbi:hypothetical protein R50072_35760 [Simiduia litorea]
MRHVAGKFPFYSGAYSVSLTTVLKHSIGGHFVENPGQSSYFNGTAMLIVQRLAAFGMRPGRGTH